MAIVDPFEEQPIKATKGIVDPLEETGGIVDPLESTSDLSPAQRLQQKTKQYREHPGQGFSDVLSPDLPLGIIEQIPAGIQAVGGVVAGGIGGAAGILTPGKTAEQGYHEGADWFNNLGPVKYMTPETKSGQAIAGLFGAGVEAWKDKAQDPKIIKTMLGAVPFVGDQLKENVPLQAGLSAGLSAVPELAMVVPGLGRGAKEEKPLPKGDDSLKPDATKPGGIIDPEDAPANLGANELVQKAIDNAYRTRTRAEYEINKIEQQLNDPEFARKSPEEAASLKAELMQQATEHQQDIERMNETIRNGHEILGKDLPEDIPARPEPREAVTPEDVRMDQDVTNAENNWGKDQPYQGNTGGVADLSREDLIRQYANEQGINIDEARAQIERDMADGNQDAGLPPQERAQAIPDETTVAPDETAPTTGEDLTTVPTKELEDRISSLDPFSAEGKAQFEALSNELTSRTPPKPKGIVLNGGSATIRAAVTGWLKKLGLDKEDLEINLDSENIPNKNWAGDSTVHPNDRAEINVRAAKAYEEKLNADPELRRWVKGLSDQQNARFREAWTAVHEMGHILLAKLLQNKLYSDSLGLGKLIKDFDAYKEKVGTAQVRKEGQLFANPRNPDYYLDFPEYFAQRVAKALLMGEKAPAGPITKYVRDLKDLWHHVRVSLNLPVFKKNFVDDFIIDLVNKNKEQLRQTGKTLFEIDETSVSLYDAWKWQFDNLMPHRNKAAGDKLAGMEDNGRDYRKSIGSAYDQIRDAHSAIELQHTKGTDINPLGIGTGFRQIGDLITKGTSYLFGIQQKKGIFADSPVVVYSANTVLNALRKQTQRSMELLSGVTDRAAWDKSNKPLWFNLQKIKNGDAPSVIFDKSSNEDFHAVHKVFEQGLGTHSYDESLAAFGGHLTESQKVLFGALAKMYKRMYKMAASLEGELGKKKIIPNMKGWYPTVRNGEFSVSFYHPGMNQIAAKLANGERVMTDLVYRQHFRTKEEAAAFIKHFESQSKEFRGKLRHNGIEEMGQTEMPNNMAEFAKAVQEQMDVAKAQGLDPHDQIRRMVEMYIARGGTLGSHQKMRMNIPGSMGSEMFKDVGTAGKAFRDAQFDAVNEYTRLMMKMEVGEKLDLVLSDKSLGDNYPNTVEVAKLIRDYALNKVDTPMQMKGFKRWVDGFWADTFHRNPLKFWGAKKYPDAYLTDSFLGKMSHFFYLNVLMGRPAFWVAQGTQFMWSARSLMKEGVGPVDAMTAAGKGFARLLHPDKDLLDALFWQSQNSHTFSPQFINDLNKFHIADFMKEGGKGRLIFDLLTGEKESTMADTFSRLMTYAWMHEHYKAQGLTGETLWKKAGEATDENMVQYGRQYKAPVFQKLGLLGDMISPLQTFSQASLGNFVADIRDMARAPGGVAKLKASLPFMSTVLITSLMAGAIGAPLAAEYEGLRLIINSLMDKFGLESKLPSLMDIVLSGDNDFSHRVLSHGLISASTLAVSNEGFDMGSSNRWQPLFNGALEGQRSALEFLPVINFIGQQAGYVKDIVENATGWQKHSDAEIRTAKIGIAPGWTKGLVDEYLGAGDRKMVPDNKGNAFIPQTGEERVSKFLGAPTIPASVERLRNRRFIEQKMRDQSGADQIKELLVDAVQHGDHEKVSEYAHTLATKYGMDDQQIRSFAEAEMFRRKIPEGMRRFVGKSGTSTKQQQQAYKQWTGTYGDNPFEDVRQQEQQ